MDGAAANMKHVVDEVDAALVTAKIVQTEQ